MIALRNAQGETLRWLNADEATEFLYTDELGLVSAAAAAERARIRKRSGLRAVPAPLFRFRAEKGADGLKVLGAKGCTITPKEAGIYKLEASGRLYYLHANAVASAPVEVKVVPRDRHLKAWASLALTAALLIALLIGLEKKSEEQAQAPEQKKEAEAPVVVRPMEKMIPKPVEQPKHVALDPKVKAQKALTQNLGFLKTLGRKDLKKAIGGLPQPVANPTAGAGAGGGAGSGGQLLQGLGEGLRKTTVGNTGVAGLGGIGTKGAGGGLGGYGDTLLGSGAGEKLSMVPLAREATVEGGLDRSLIQSTILRYLNQVRACYEEGLKRNASLLGKVEMAFSIDGQGRVPESRVARSSLPDAEVGNCIAAKMHGWQFPQPKGGVTVKVQYPFMLRPI